MALLEGPADSIRCETTDSGLWKSIGQDCHANESEQDLETSPQSSGVAASEEQVDAPKDANGVDQAAEHATQAVDESDLPVESPEQSVADSRDDANQDSGYKADGETPEVSARRADAVERREHKGNDRVGRHECPYQKAEQSREGAHRRARSCSQEDCGDDDRHHAERRHDRADRDGAKRRKADNRLDGKQHGKLRQGQCFIAM